MTQEKQYSHLLERLGEAHDSVVLAQESRAKESQANIRSFLNQSIARAHSNRTEKGAPGERRPFSTRRLAMTLAVPGMAFAAAALFLKFKPLPRVDIHPENLSQRQRASLSPVPALPSPAKVGDPCARRLHAVGKTPLIDDFEDANPLIVSEEGRVALWALYQDNEAPGAASALAPTLRPQPTRANRYALHVKGGELRAWGAALQISFTPSCYDASVYAGISFSAKGPGRIYAGVREVRTVPVEYGGTCMKDCYDSHQKKVNLSSAWGTYSIEWGEMHQRGYDTPPLDSTRINSLSFLIQPGDTPFDLWIDDVKFIPAH